MAKVHQFNIYFKTIKNTISNLFANEKLDDANSDIYCQKIQFLTNKCEVWEHLMASMSATMDKDENVKGVITSEQYQESLKAY